MKLPFDVTQNPTWQGVETAKRIADAVATGRRRMGMLCSDTGYGKTLVVRRSMRIAQCSWREVSPGDEHSLINTLWSLTRDMIGVGVMDDVDRAARNETLANHMKSGFGDDRRIIHQSMRSIRNEEYRTATDQKKKDRYNPAIPPLEFILTMRLLWLSNVNWTDPAVFGRTPEHFRAMVSKGLDPHWIPNDIANDGFAVFCYVMWLATEGKSLRSAGFRYEVARAAVEFYIGNVHRLIDICPRRMWQIACAIRDYSDPTAREYRLSEMLRSTDQRPKLKLPESWVPVLLWPIDPPQPPDPPPAAQYANPDADPPLTPNSSEVEAEPANEPTVEPRQPPKGEQTIAGSVATQVMPLPVKPDHGAGQASRVTEPAAEPVVEAAIDTIVPGMVAKEQLIDDAISVEPIADEVICPESDPVALQEAEPEDDAIAVESVEQVIHPEVEQPTVEPVAEAVVREEPTVVAEAGPAEAAAHVDHLPVTWQPQNEPTPIAQDSDPWERNVHEVEMSPDEYGAIAHEYVHRFAGKASKDDRDIEDLMVRFYGLVGKLLSPTERNLLKAQKKSYWRGELGLRERGHSNSIYRATPRGMVDRAGLENL